AARTTPGTSDGAGGGRAPRGASPAVPTAPPYRDGRPRAWQYPRPSRPARRARQAVPPAIRVRSCRPPQDTLVAHHGVVNRVVDVQLAIMQDGAVVAVSPDGRRVMRHNQDVGAS